MQKIISLFQRNYETDRLVRDEVVPGAEWVTKGEGIPEKMADHTLVKHGDFHLPLSTPRNFEGLKHYLTGHPDIEGIVWHHPDGRMVKIKRKDFVKQNRNS